MEEITSIEQLREKFSDSSSSEPAEDNTTTQHAESSAELSAKNEKAEESTEKEEKVDEKVEEPTEKVEKEAKTDAIIPVEEKPTFVPNYEYQAGGQKHQVPERFRPLMTDEASQNEVLDLLSKANGLEAHKKTYERVKERNDYYEKELVPSFTKQNDTIKELVNFVEKNDWDSYFEKLGIDEKRLQQWMYSKLTLTDEQKALYNQNRELQKQNYKFQSDNQNLVQAVDAGKREQSQAEAVKMLNALDYITTNGEHKDVAKSFDETNGAGSFKNKVIEYGKYIEATQGKSLEPQEAIDGFLKFSNYKAATANTTVQAGDKSFPKEKPTLPVVSAKPQSPSSQQITSIKQIRQRANELRAE